MTAKYQADSSVNQQYQLIKLAWSHYQSAPESLDPEKIQALQKQAAIMQRLMIAVLTSPEAQNENVIAPEVEFIVEQLKQQFENIASFDLSLEQQGLSMDALKQAIYQDLLCEKTIATQSQDFPPTTEQQALAYYQKNRERFKRPERRKVSHILITINDESIENKRAQAQTRINGVKKQLSNNIKLFAALAAKYSECPTALNKGLVGEVSRGQLYPELDQVLFTMQPHTISSVVESEIGLHLLLCHEIYPASETAQVDAVDAIIKQLNEHRRKKCEKKWLSGLLAREQVSN